MLGGFHFLGSSAASQTAGWRRQLDLQDAKGFNWVLSGLGFEGIELGSKWLSRDNGKENGNYYNDLYKGFYWVYRGILEKKMETTVQGSGFRGCQVNYGLKSLKGVICWGLLRVSIRGLIKRDNRRLEYISRVNRVSISLGSLKPHSW